MDNSKRIILDISSDEEVGWGESGVSFDGGDGYGRDDCDWLTEIFNEVTVVGEVISNPKQMLAKCVDDDDDGDEDDCVILDGDPDKHITIQNDGGDDSDDLCLISEKGQVACRDYPHPRHLCVKFPFNSTPHEGHCDLCHCYVCDSIAPCVQWGNGISSIDHCHATDKDEYWKAQRKVAKTSHKALPFASKAGSIPTNQVPSLPGNPLMHNPGLPARQSGSIPSTRIPYCVMPVRTQEAGCNPSNKSQSYAVNRHLLRQNVGHAGTQFISQYVPFKTPGTFGGTLTTDRHCNQYQGGKTQEGGGVQCQAHANMPRQILVGDSSTCSTMGNQTSQPQSQVYSQIHNGSVRENSAAPCAQIPSLPCAGVNLVNLMPTVPGVTTQQWWESHLGNPLPLLKPRAASQKNV